MISLAVSAQFFVAADSQAMTPAKLLDALPSSSPGFAEHLPIVWAARLNVMDLSWSFRGRAVRETLSGELGRTADGVLRALETAWRARHGKNTLGVDHQLPRCVIDRGGPEQNDRVEDLAVPDGLFLRADAAGGSPTVHE